MIEANEVKKTLDQYYDEVINRDGSVFKCKKIFDKQAYQYFYFDYSGKPEKTEEFYRELLAEDYYKNQGSLQWNFYLAFLTEERINTRLKEEIEKNEDFARKFVLQYEDLDKWLNRLYNTEFESDQADYQDLAVVWTEVLKSNGLDCVYSDNIDDDEGIDGIIKGEPIEEAIEVNSTQDVDDKDINLGFLQELDPRDFRDHLNYGQSSFEFSKVNLIDGVNGSGKTTLLEAIEFFITGSNFRDDENTSSKETSALLEGRKEFIESPDPNNYDLFRARDKAWYNSASRIRGSILNSNFNKFNFFNTDAAFRLSHEKKSEKEIENAFREIALGEDVSRIKREIKRYKRKFDDERRERKSKLDALYDELTDKEETLSELEEVGESPEKLFEEFKDELKSINWVGYIPKSIDQNLEKLSIQMTKTDSILESLFELEWLKNDSIKSLKNEKVRVQKLKDYCSSKKDLLTENHNLENEQERLNHKREVLTRLKIYYSTEIEDIIGLNQKIEEKSNYVEKLSSIKNKFSDIDYGVFTDVSRTLDDRLDEDSQIKLEKEKQLKQHKNQIDEVKSGISELEDILSTLRSKGLQFVEKSGTDICPLCKHEYTDDQELIERINQAHSKLQSSDLLTTLITKKEETESDVEALDKQIKILAQLKEVFLKLDLKSEINKNSLADLVNKAESTIENLSNIKRDLEELRAFQENLNEEGLKESEIESLLEKLNDINYKVPESVDEIESWISELDKESKVLSKKTGKNKSDTKDLNEKIVEYSFSDDAELPLEIIDNQLSTINHHISQVESIKGYINFSNSQILLELKQQIQSLDEILGKIREQKDFKNKTDDQYKKVQKRIKEVKPKIQFLEKEVSRIENALKTFEELNEQYSEDDFLADFLGRNKSEIESIFLAIHSPNEFSEVVLDDNGLKVKRVSTGEIHGLNSISTGQRSALALSVFLTLNSKLNNGPQYVLLDDPVAFIDDLNILSFIDYLREIAIHSDKQIFFATANQDLAFLFRKKFELLGDDFTRIKLD